MASIKFSGMDEFMQRIQKIDQRTIPIVKMSVFEGAAVVVAAVENSIQNSVSGRLPIPLAKGLGVSRMRVNGRRVNVLVGFDGYYENHEGRTVPIPYLARMVESGTSTIQKQPFMRPAIEAAESAALAAMEAKFNEEIDKMMK